MGRGVDALVQVSKTHKDPVYILKMLVQSEDTNGADVQNSDN